MIVGIEETTDSRHPETEIVKLASEAAARRWLQKSGDYAWPGAAQEDIPPSQQNWHRRLRKAYVMPTGWRMPSAKAIDAEWRRVRGWERNRSYTDIKASMIYKAAVREIQPEPPQTTETGDPKP